ncbi:MAG: tyrosine--tRNA ligase [Candidatus Buchananbacteria bacterium RIFCSPHIGHO2_01_FULL_47_11b]|uniref:Tyrosine--tRNA ligase n=1 Tax=Candidatus Buchananbacteria bacterium RIFCSPHIGHO2_01_FULL_47_11b TaxID=1797537 RepID=A0A1G1Y5N8_9BACT|nr:MAG: tyrosine--tRNA ligase [Candidatus Buchananbacteria bacterium RIFCSPHIGHO2_01_FULL_47_11b]
MATNTDSAKINELLTRGVSEVIDASHLKKRLKSGKQLRVKFGIDPTSPHIHIGRTIPLLKLRDFQELGHKIVLIIGDFTGVIGDTSDKDSERPMLTEKQVQQNMADYQQQAGKIIDLKKCKIHFNSEWLAKLNYHQIGRQADIFSLNEFISRENIAKRLKAGRRVSLRELLYPLMQGYDSVAVRADVEIGGTDQRFNLLAGRELQRSYQQEPQDIITNPLLEGLDGRKMSSSWGNTVNIADTPEEMYGKLMSLHDELIITYLTLATRVPLQEIKVLQYDLRAGKNPKVIKMLLAYKIVESYHGQKAAITAEENFKQVFEEKLNPDKISTFKIKQRNIVDVLVATKLASSKSEARRLLGQKAIRVDAKIVIDPNYQIGSIDADGVVLQRGKRHFAKII